MEKILAYIAFSRKYRPKDFSQIIGQEAIVKTLKNAIELNRISHAYIFAGPRGVGKTTISRILTKCLNCKEGITTTPCNKCENCIEIDKGSFPDMYEIDAASNRGIDDIRSLKENVNYAPIKGRYKVYIIDEAHMLTREAFNALLKTLEEPPPNNIFILATTELHKIPDTIKSRCQIFIFKPPTTSQIKQYMKYILENEKIPYEEKALDLLSQSSEGGVRDSASLLDQATTYGKGEITLKAVEEMLGVIPQNIVKRFLQRVKEQNIEKLIKGLEKLDKEGYDLNIFWKQVLDYMHDELIKLSLGEKGEVFEEEDKKAFIYLLEVFNQAYIQAKTNFSPKNVYQLAVLKLEYIDSIQKIENLLSGSTESIEIKTQVKKETSQPKQETQKIDTKTKQSSRPDMNTILENIRKNIGGVVAATLEKSKIEETADNFVIFLEDSIVPFINDKLQEISKYFPKPVEIREVRKEKKQKAKKRDETVEEALELFQGKVIKYQEE